MREEKTEEEIRVFRVNMYILELIYVNIVEDMKVFQKNRKKKNAVDKKPFYDIMKTQQTTYSKYKNSDDKIYVTTGMMRLLESCPALEGVFEGKKIIELPGATMKWAIGLCDESGRILDDKKNECKDKVKVLVKGWKNKELYNEKSNAYKITEWMYQEIQTKMREKGTVSDRVIERSVMELKKLNAEQINSCHTETLEELYKELERVSLITVTIKKYRDLMERQKNQSR